MNETDPPAPVPEPRGSSLGRASALLASGTIVSRILGFISAIVLAQTLGTQGSGADSFALANQLPNNIYAIVAGGVLSAVLVPQIVRAGLHADGGTRFINRIVTLGIVVFVAAAAIATLAAPFLVRIYAQQADGGSRGFSTAELALATAFAYWCLPQILFYALYSLLGEVLNARKVFGPFTWAPVLNNIVAIAGLLGFAAFFGTIDVRDAAAWTPAMITVIAGTATAGVAVQAGMLFFFWRRAGLRYRPEFRWHGVGLGGVGKASAWVFAMILVTQLAGIVQTNVASLAGGEASLAVLRFSWLIFMLPHSVVTVSIATAYFTRMSSHARDANLDSLKADVSASIRTIGLIMVFATVGLMCLAYPVAALFSPGDVKETTDMGNVLLAFLPGLIPFSILFVLQRTFYSLEDTRTPFFIQLAQSGLFVAGAIVVAGLPAEWIAVGIGVVTTIAGTVQTGIAGWLLGRRLGGFGGARIVRSHALYLLAALPTTGAGIALASALGAFSNGLAVSGLSQALLCSGAVALLMLVVYIGALAVLRAPELRELALPFIRRSRKPR